eukprot:6206817-Pleurochrysis_carterae.AAC.2
MGRKASKFGAKCVSSFRKGVSERVSEIPSGYCNDGKREIGLGAGSLRAGAQAVEREVGAGARSLTLVGEGVLAELPRTPEAGAICVAAADRVCAGEADDLAVGEACGLTKFEPCYRRRQMVRWDAERV